MDSVEIYVYKCNAEPDCVFVVHSLCTDSKVKDHWMPAVGL